MDERSLASLLIDQLEVEHNRAVAVKSAESGAGEQPPEPPTAQRLRPVDLSQYRLDIDGGKNPRVACFQALTELREHGRTAAFVQIDDAENLSKFALLLVRTLTEWGELPLGIMIAGPSELLGELPERQSPFVRLFTGFVNRLEPFTREETKEALSKPLEGTGIEWSDEAIEVVQSESWGHPYLVVCTAEQAFYLLGTSKTFTKEVVDKAIPLTTVACEDWLRREVGRVPPGSELVILEKAVEQGGKVRLDQVEYTDPIRRLLDKDLLVKEKRGEYVLAKPPLAIRYLIEKGRTA